jgi:zinc protease
MLPVLLLSTALAGGLEVPHQQYTLDNGLTVVLVEDHSLPQVVINLWYDVGSKDERAGRTGFAHLFEHLMFMGTTRLPGSGFDDLMEAEGGWNNAWTSEDATDYYSVGPSQLLTTLLWMDADRMEGLAGAMTQDKLDLQREVVRNERRQSYENAPYGELWLTVPQVMYPQGHPYAHTVIGSHEDLQNAELQDVIDFFQSWYVPNNCSLVVAGDFDPAELKPFLLTTFGSLKRTDTPARVEHTPVDKPVVPLTELTDDVEVPMSTLLWHSPAAFAPGDAEHDLLADILAGGRSSRLYRRLVVQDGLATEVEAYQSSQQLQSLFMIQVKPTEGHTLPELEAVVFDELVKLAASGPTEAELKATRNRTELAFLQGLESLHARATRLNRYVQAYGTADKLQDDVDRYRKATAEDLARAAAGLTADRAALVRILPASTEEN